MSHPFHKNLNDLGSHSGGTNRKSELSKSNSSRKDESSNKKSNQSSAKDAQNNHKSFPGMEAIFEDRKRSIKASKSVSTGPGGAQRDTNLKENGKFQKFEAKEKENKEIGSSKKASEIDIDKELSIISQEMSFIDSGQKKDAKSLHQINNFGKFKISNTQLNLDEKKERYKDIIYRFASDNDMVCVVCLDGEGTVGDDIFICDLCGAAFHQSCYGSDLLDMPEELDASLWFCQRCTYLMDSDLPPTAVRCEFCPEMKGAIKRITPESDSYWGHLNCVNWIPEIYYIDDRKENVFIGEYWKKTERRDLRCEYCKIRYGDCIQCDSKECDESFHVTCAHIHGLIASWKDMLEMKRDDDEDFYLPVYCKKHMRNYRLDMFEFSNKVEKKNLRERENISLLYHPKEDISDLIKEKQKKLRNFEKVLSAEFKKHKASNHDKDTEHVIKKKRSSTAKRSPLQIDSSENIKKPVLKRLDKINKEETKEIETSKKMIPEPTPEPPHILATRPAKKSVPKSGGGKSEPEPVKLVKAVSKEAEIVKPVKPAPKEPERAAEAEVPKLYKFKPEMAQFIKKQGWLSEKEAKQEIQKFINQQHLYNKDKREIEVFKDTELADLLQVQTIPKEHIFKKFKAFMYEKVESENGKDGNLPFFEMYQKEAEKMRKERDLDAQTKKNLEKAADKSPKANAGANISRERSHPQTSHQGHVGQKTSMNEEAKKKYEEYDPLAWRKDKNLIKKPQKETGLNAKRDGSAVFDLFNKSEDDYIVKKTKLNPDRNGEHQTTAPSILDSLLNQSAENRQEQITRDKTEVTEGLSSLVNKGDKMPFRKNMRWFTRSDEEIEIESINSNKIIRTLWPKAAEILF